MKPEVDKEFFERADAYITIANEQAANVGRGKVSASLMFATARFNAWVSASGTELASVKEEALEYFLNEYRQMLEENLNEYIEHFDDYMKA
jgi:hypothetical protein